MYMYMQITKLKCYKEFVYITFIPFVVTYSVEYRKLIESAPAPSETASRTSSSV